MIIVLFRSRLTGEAGADYSDMAQEMLARAKNYPGFIGFKSFKAEDGERLSVVRWESEALLKPWREDERHRVAQRTGREKWYEEYSIEVTEVLRSRDFHKH